MGMGVPWVSGILCSEDVKPKKGTHLKSPQDLASLFGLTKPRYLNDFAYDSIVLKCWFSSAQTVTPCQRVVTILHGYIPLHSHDIPSQPPLPSPAAHLRNPQATAFLGALCRLQKDGTSALAPDVASGPGTLLPQVWGLVHPTNWVKGRTANVLWVSKACKILDPHPT